MWPPGLSWSSLAQAMNALDLKVLHLLNGFVNHWPRFDDLVVFIADAHLVKGGVIALLLWWAWFSQVPRARDKVLCGLMGGFLALAIARVMAHLLPFRIRPVVDPTLDLHRAPGLYDALVEHWGSAFPSDHAALFVPLCVALWVISRPVGAFALAHTAVIILLPRVYLGLHRPSDLLGGAAVGILAFTAVWVWPTRDRVVRALLGWERRRPAFFYPLLFLFIFELTEVFLSFRFGLALLRRLLGLSAG